MDYSTAHEIVRDLLGAAQNGPGWSRINVEGGSVKLTMFVDHVNGRNVMTHSFDMRRDNPDTFCVYSVSVTKGSNPDVAQVARMLAAFFA